MTETGTEQRRKSWISFGHDDAMPCPKCGSRDLEFNANVVVCMDCEHWGPGQEGPEFMCDWRDAINDWNIAAGGSDFFQRPTEKLIELGLIEPPARLGTAFPGNETFDDEPGRA